MRINRRMNEKKKKEKRYHAETLFLLLSFPHVSGQSCTDSRTDARSDHGSSFRVLLHSVSCFLELCVHLLPELRNLFVRTLTSFLDLLVCPFLRFLEAFSMRGFLGRRFLLG